MARKPIQRRPFAPKYGTPDCPDGIEQEARVIFAQLVVPLKHMGAINPADGPALARYCQLWVRWQRAEQFLAQYGETYPVKSGTGVVKCFFPAPQVAIARNLAALLTKLEKELGLTPAARATMDDYLTPGYNNPREHERLMAGLQNLVR